MSQMGDFMGVSRMAASCGGVGSKASASGQRRKRAHLHSVSQNTHLHFTLALSRYAGNAADNKQSKNPGVK
jgi:hypothetical protein